MAPIPESTKDADPQVKAKGTAKSFDQESGDSDLEESCDPFQESFNETLKADKNIPQLKNMPLGKAEKFQSAEPGFRGSDYIETYRDTDEKRVAGYEKSLKTPTYDQRERSKSETKDLKSASNSSMKGAKSKSLEIPNYPGVSAQSALHRETPGDDASSKRIDVQEDKFTSVDEVDLEESKDEVVEEVSETGMKKEALYRNFEQLPNSVSPKQSTLSSIKEDDRKFVHYTLPMILPTGRSITTTNSSRTGYPVISSRGGTGPEIHTGSLPSQYAGILKEVGPKQESANIKVDGDQFTANNDIIEKMTTQNTTGDSADSRGEPRKNEICNSLLLMSPAQEEEDSEVIFKKNNASHISFADSADSRDEPRKDEIFNSRLSMSPAQEEEESEVTFKKNNASHTSFADSADSRDEPRTDEIFNSRLSMSPAQEEEESEVTFKKNNASHTSFADSADSRDEPRTDEIFNSRLSMSPAQEEEESEVTFKKNNASHTSFADLADSRDEPRTDEIFNSRLSMSPAQEEEESEVTFKKNNASHTSFADLADSRDDPRNNKICNSLPSMSPAQEEAVPSQSSPSLVDSPPSESKEGTSSRSTFSSFISSVFEKLGLGRQPVFPGEANAASRNSPGMPFPQSGISNSAVAIEHNESGVGEVGDTSLKTLKGNFVSDSEKKINRRFEGNLKDQLKEGSS